MQEMLEKLPGSLSVVFWVFNATNIRWTPAHQNMKKWMLGDPHALKEEARKGIFGDEVLEISVLIFTHAPGHNEDISENHLDELSRLFGKKEGRMPHFLLDCKSTHPSFMKQKEKIKNYIKQSMPQEISKHPVMSHLTRDVCSLALAEFHAYWVRREEAPSLEIDITEIMQEFNRNDKEKRISEENFISALMKEVDLKLKGKLDLRVQEFIDSAVQQMQEEERMNVANVDDLFTIQKRGINAKDVIGLFGTVGAVGVGMFGGAAAVTAIGGITVEAGIIGTAITVAGGGVGALAAVILIGCVALATSASWSRETVIKNKALPIIMNLLRSGKLVRNIENAIKQVFVNYGVNRAL